MKFYRIWALFKKDLLWTLSNKSILNYLTFHPAFFLIFFIGAIYFNKLQKVSASYLLFLFLLLGLTAAMKIVLLEKEEQTFFNLLTSPIKIFEFLIAKLIYPFLIISVFTLLTLFTNAFIDNQASFLNPLLIFNLFLMGLSFCLLGFTFGIRSKNALEKANFELFVFPAVILILLASLKDVTLPPEFFIAGNPADIKLANFVKSFLALNQRLYFFNPFSHFFELFKSPYGSTSFWNTGFHIAYFLLALSIALSSVKHVFSQIKKFFALKKYFIAFLFLFIVSGLTSLKKVLLFLGLSFLPFSSLTIPFWKIEKNNETFYMLGTVDAGISIEDLQCSKTVKEKIKESGQIFVESFSSASRDFLSLNLKDKKKIYMGTKEERKKIMNSKIREFKEAVEKRYSILKLTIIKATKSSFIKQQGLKIIPDQGKFEDLSEKSQNFLIQHGLYEENKNYLDYFFDLKTMAFYDSFFSYKPSSFLDDEIKQLALNYNIPIKALDKDHDIIVDLEKEIKKIDGLKGQNTSFDNKYIDLIINNYDTLLKQVNTVLFSSVVSDYKSKDWKSLTEKIQSDNFGNALLKNRNESWIEKMLLASKNQDKAIFVAGGTAHFIGPNNVLSLLKKLPLQKNLWVV